MNVCALPLAILFVVAAAESPLQAECAGLSTPSLRRLADWVFEGTVVALAGDPGARYQSVTTDVHWVWKGNVSRRARVYLEKSIDSPQLSVGDRRVFFGTFRSKPEEPSYLRDEGLRPVFLRPCVGVTSTDGQFTNPLGRPRRP